MQKLFLIAITLLLISNYSPAQDIHSLKLKTAVTIDGSPDEWPQPFNYYNGETKLQYRIANDSSNIYVCFKVTDEPAQMKMMRAGINVWLDPKGKKKETTGINFPMKQDHTSSIETPHSQTEGHGQIPGQTYQKHDFRNFKARATAQQITMKVQGFTGVSDQVTGIKNDFGILAAFNWDSLDILCIEYQIPIALVLQHRLSAADTLKPIGIGFVVNATDASSSWGGEHQGNWGGNRNADESSEMNGSMNAGMNNGMNGGINNRTGGMNRDGQGVGMGGGEAYRSNNGGGNYSEMAQEHKVWSKLILNAN